jgi:hypothetical protein
MSRGPRRAVCAFVGSRRPTPVRTRVDRRSRGRALPGFCDLRRMAARLIGDRFATAPACAAQLLRSAACACAADPRSAIHDPRSLRDRAGVCCPASAIAACACAADPRSARGCMHRRLRSGRPPGGVPGGVVVFTAGLRPVPGFQVAAHDVRTPPVRSRAGPGEGRRERARRGVAGGPPAAPATHGMPAAALKRSRSRGRAAAGRRLAQSSIESTGIAAIPWGYCGSAGISCYRGGLWRE